MVHALNIDYIYTTVNVSNLKFCRAVVLDFNRFRRSARRGAFVRKAGASAARYDRATGRDRRRDAEAGRN